MATAKKATPRKTEATRAILVKLDNGETKIVRNVPASAKITFGTVHAGAEKGFHGRGYALRIYTTQNNQLAVFTNVAEFRDLALTVEKRVKNVDSKHAVKHDKHGRTYEAGEQVEYSFVEEVV